MITFKSFPFHLSDPSAHPQNASPIPRNSSTYGIAKFLNAQHAAALATREAEHGILVYPNKTWELED